MSRCPFLTLESDVTDVVYLTWLVPVEACRPLIPPGVKVWQRQGLTAFTVLTYQHGHFGPAFLGSLRKWCLWPLQSNWRFYLEHAPPGAPPVPMVLFLKNVMNSLAYTLGTRLFSDALPTHLADRFVHVRQGSVFHTEISSGQGSAPSLTCSVRVGQDETLSSRFEAAFGSWRDAVQFLTCQHAAVAPVERCGRLAFGEIDLPIDVSKVLPAQLAGSPVMCPFLDSLQAEGPPLCFVVPSVRFRVLSERLL